MNALTPPAIEARFWLGRLVLDQRTVPRPVRQIIAQFLSAPHPLAQMVAFSHDDFFPSAYVCVRLEICRAFRVLGRSTIPADRAWARRVLIYWQNAVREGHYLSGAVVDTITDFFGGLLPPSAEIWEVIREFTG